MPLIVNLSAVHSLYPIANSVSAFAELCNNYSRGCLSNCPRFFQSMNNYAWVFYQYYSKYKTLIEPYRLGKISTEQFLKNLAEIFYFLTPDTVLREEDLEKIKEMTAVLSQENYLALLEIAWNEIIGLDEDKINRLPKLREQGEPIYLISNTNELNVNKILTLLKANNPDVKFKDNIDISVNKDKTPVEIAPNIFLCLSYRYQLFKTESQNIAVSSYSTMSLLNYLLTNNLKGQQIEVISQFQADLDEAAKLGIEPANLHKADDYFITQPGHKKNI